MLNSNHGNLVSNFFMLDFDLIRTERRNQVKLSIFPFIQLKGGIWNERKLDDDAINFVFADINYSLGVRFNDGSFKYFNSEQELHNITEN